MKLELRKTAPNVTTKRNRLVVLEIRVSPDPTKSVIQTIVVGEVKCLFAFQTPNSVAKPNPRCILSIHARKPNHVAMTEILTNVARILLFVVHL